MGNNIKRLRKQRGLTQTQLGDKIGKDKQTVSKLEKGGIGISEDYMFLLAQALDVHPMALFDDDRWCVTYIRGHIKMGEVKASLYYAESDWQPTDFPSSKRFQNVDKFLIENKDTGALLECVDDPKYLQAVTVNKRYIVEQKVAPDRNLYLLVRVTETPDGNIVLRPEYLNGKTSAAIPFDDPCCKIVARVVGSYTPE